MQSHNNAFIQFKSLSSCFVARSGIEFPAFIGAALMFKMVFAFHSSAQTLIFHSAQTFPPTFAVLRRGRHVISPTDGSQDGGNPT
jgi:hypothetical protein